MEVRALSEPLLSLIRSQVGKLLVEQFRVGGARPDRVSALVAQIIRGGNADVQGALGSIHAARNPSANSVSLDADVLGARIFVVALGVISANGPVGAHASALSLGAVSPSVGLSGLAVRVQSALVDGALSLTAIVSAADRSKLRGSTVLVRLASAALGSLHSGSSDTSSLLDVASCDLANIGKLLINGPLVAVNVLVARNACFASDENMLASSDDIAGVSCAMLLVVANDGSVHAIELVAVGSGLSDAAGSLAGGSGLAHLSAINGVAVLVGIGDSIAGSGLIVASGHLAGERELVVNSPLGAVEHILALLGASGLGVVLVGELASLDEVASIDSASVVIIADNGLSVAMESLGHRIDDAISSLAGVSGLALLHASLVLGIALGVVDESRAALLGCGVTEGLDALSEVLLLCPSITVGDTAGAVGGLANRLAVIGSVHASGGGNASINGADVVVIADLGGILANMLVVDINEAQNVFALASLFAVFVTFSARATVGLCHADSQLLVASSIVTSINLSSLAPLDALDALVADLGTISANGAHDGGVDAFSGGDVARVGSAVLVVVAFVGISEAVDLPVVASNAGNRFAEIGRGACLLAQGGGDAGGVIVGSDIASSKVHVAHSLLALGLQRGRESVAVSGSLALSVLGALIGDGVDVLASFDIVTSINSALLLVIAVHGNVNTIIGSSRVNDAGGIVASIVGGAALLAGLLGLAGSIVSRIGLAASAGLITSGDLAVGSQVELLGESSALAVLIAVLEASLLDVLSEGERASSGVDIAKVHGAGLVVIANLLIEAAHKVSGERLIARGGEAGVGGSAVGEALLSGDTSSRSVHDLASTQSCVAGDILAVQVQLLLKVHFGAVLPDLAGVIAQGRAELLVLALSIQAEITSAKDAIIAVSVGSSAPRSLAIGDARSHSASISGNAVGASSGAVVGAVVANGDSLAASGVEVADGSLAGLREFLIDSPLVAVLVVGARERAVIALDELELASSGGIAGVSGAVLLVVADNGSHGAV